MLDFGQRQKKKKKKASGVFCFRFDAKMKENFYMGFFIKMQPFVKSDGSQWCVMWPMLTISNNKASCWDQEETVQPLFSVTLGFQLHSVSPMSVTCPSRCG